MDRELDLDLTEHAAEIGLGTSDSTPQQPFAAAGRHLGCQGALRTMASPTTPTSKVKCAPIETGGVGISSSGDDEGSGRPSGGGGTCG
jgi:hypothetical protein